MRHRKRSLRLQKRPLFMISFSVCPTDTILKRESVGSIFRGGSETTHCPGSSVSEKGADSYHGRGDISLGQ